MAADPYDIKLTLGGTSVGLMLVSPPGQTKQLSIAEVGGPNLPRGMASTIPSIQDFDPMVDVPFSMSDFSGGVGQLEVDNFHDETAYWWSTGIATHVTGKAYLAPPPISTLYNGVDRQIIGFYTYEAPNGTRYDFHWAGEFLYRRPATDSTTAWALMWTCPFGAGITDFTVFNGVGVIVFGAVFLDAFGGDFYTQADVTAAATWGPTLRNHAAFSDALGKPKYVCAVRGTLYAACSGGTGNVANSKVMYTVDATVDGWVGPITVTVGAISSPNVGENTYGFIGLKAVNDYLFCFKKNAVLSINAQQVVTEVIWQWKDKPSTENFKQVATGMGLLFYNAGPEVYAYNPVTGLEESLKLSVRPGFSCQKVLGIAADSRYVYVSAQIMVPSINTTARFAMLRGYRLPGKTWAFENIYDNTLGSPPIWFGVYASPNGAGTRLYQILQSGALNGTNITEIPPDWDESTVAIQATGPLSLYTSISRSGFPAFSKRFTSQRMQTEGTTAFANRVAGYYSIDNGNTYNIISTTGGGASGVLDTDTNYSNVTSRSVSLRFDFYTNGAANPVLRFFNHHQRPRFKYLPAVTAQVRVASYLEMNNGAPDTQTAAQINATLQTMRENDAQNSILYEDFLGNSWVATLDTLDYMPSRTEIPLGPTEMTATLKMARVDGGL